jgi:hypothetical protein
MCVVFFCGKILFIVKRYAYELTLSGKTGDALGTGQQSVFIAMFEIYYSGEFCRVATYQRARHATVVLITANSDNVIRSAFGNFSLSNRTCSVEATQVTAHPTTLENSNALDKDPNDTAVCYPQKLRTFSRKT